MREISAPTCVIATLDLGQRLALRVVLAARPLDGGLDRALIGDRRLQGDVARRQHGLPRAGLVRRLAQLERQELRLELSLVLLERLITARRGRLALQVLELLVDLVAQIVESLEILARMRDTALGLRRRSL